MVHQAEISFQLPITNKKFIQIIKSKSIKDYDVVFLRLPDLSKEQKQKFSKKTFENSELHLICSTIRNLTSKLNKSCKLLIMGDPFLLPFIHSFLLTNWNFHHWFVIRLNKESIAGKFLQNEHMGVLFYTKISIEFDHSLLRIGYEYCQFCQKTTKDYGGKKHLYHSFGTSMSDVWRDISISREEFPKSILQRFQDLFSVSPNKKMLVTSLWNLKKSDLEKIVEDDDIPNETFPIIHKNNNAGQKNPPKNKLWLGDCSTRLSKIKDESVDTIFVDPPYNLAKNYDGYFDQMSMKKYFDWCDTWLSHLSRILKKGGSLFVVNIPSSTLHHFLLLNQNLDFQNWIVWSALSAPVKKILPAHYSILYFTKGDKPATFNYFGVNRTKSNEPVCEPLDYGYCIRSSCISNRSRENIKTTKILTDLWSDIHRIKHNSLRVDHPTLLPPKLLERIITLSSNKNELILDCFNGVGTTTLVSQLLGRNYLGIEKNPSYSQTSKIRHEQIKQGTNPFEKRKTVPTAKNSTLARTKIQKYAVPKKTLQLEVKTISKRIGKVPTREDIKKLSQYPIEYFDNYFRSWYEVTNAVKNTGMTETKAT